MGILTGQLQFTGRVGNLSCYQVGSRIYVRQANPHSRKTIMRHPKYELFRAYGRLMGRASKIASKVYNALPEDFREHSMYNAFVSEAMNMLKNKTRMVSDEEVLGVLWKKYVEMWGGKTVVDNSERRSIGKNEVVRTRRASGIRSGWKGNEGLGRNEQNDREERTEVERKGTRPGLAGRSYHRWLFNEGNRDEVFCCKKIGIATVEYDRLTAPSEPVRSHRHPHNRSKRFYLSEDYDERGS